MRKYLATFAVLITLFGMFAPYGFSAENNSIALGKQVAHAANNPVFWSDIKVNALSDTSIEVSGLILYTDPENPNDRDNQVSSANSDISIHLNRATDPNGNWRNDDIAQGTYYYNSAKLITVDPTEEDDLKGLDKNTEYVFWFEEENQQADGDDVESDKIKFKIADLQNNPNSFTVIPSPNNGGSLQKVQIDFANPAVVEAVAGTPQRVKMQTVITYSDSDKDPGDTVDSDDIKLYAVLTKVSDNAKLLIPIGTSNQVFKVGEPKGINFPLDQDLVVGEEYKLYIYDDQFKIDSLERYKSNEVRFTVGNLQATQVIPNQPNYDPSNGESENGFKCDRFWQFRCHLVVFTVDIITFVPMAIATLTGLLSDVFLSLAIDPTMYGGGNGLGVAIDNFLHTSWAIVRDFANIGFIFALFVASFSLIAGKDFLGFKPKDTVVRVIVMALLVNFSFFFCRMIIQTADVFSNVLYNQLSIQTSSTGTIASWAQDAGIKSPSFALVSQVNPQSLFTAAGVKVEDSGSFTAYLIVGFLGGAAYWIMIFVFVSMMLIWIGRIFGAWISIILSPLAFVSWSIPFLEKDKHIGFENWFKNLVQLAFMVPIYLFFIYLVIGVLNLTDLNKVVSGLDASGGYLVAVMAIVMKTLIPLLGAMFILIRAKKIAYDMSGEIGVMVNGLAGKATSLALGAATGGTAFMARQTLGRAGAAVANSGAVKSLSRSKYGGLIGAGIGAAGRATAASSFDVRNSPSIMKRFGQFTEKAGEKIDLGNKMLNTTGFKGEGGLRDVTTKLQGSVESKFMEWNKNTAENQKLDSSSNAERNLRTGQTQLERAKQAKDAEDSRIAFEAENQTIEEARAAFTKNKENLTADLDRMNAERATLAAIAAPTEDETKKLASLDIDISAKERQIEKAGKQEKNINIARDTDGVKDVHTARQKIKSLQLIADNSEEKANIDDAKKGMEDAKTKMTETNKEISDLNKDLKNLSKDDDPELYEKTQADIKKKKEDLSKNRVAYDDARQKHKSTEDIYKKKHEDTIKALKDFTKDAIDNYKKDEKVVDRVKAKQDAVMVAQMQVNEYQNAIDEVNYQNQAAYAKNLQASDSYTPPTANTSKIKMAGDMKTALRTIAQPTGMANGRSADQIRRSITENVTKLDAKKGGDVKKDDAPKKDDKK